MDYNSFKREEPMISDDNSSGKSLFRNIQEMGIDEIITLLEHLDSYTIASALMDADETTRRLVFDNLSERAYLTIINEMDRLSENI